MEAQLTHCQTEGNRRSDRRRRVYKHARIIFNNGYAALDCIVRNTSIGGAMLEMEPQPGVPRAFHIILDRAVRARSCHVIWRTERRTGIAFDESSSAPL